MQRADLVRRPAQRLSAVAGGLLAVTLLMAGCTAGIEPEPDSEGAEPRRTVAGESVEPGTPLRDGFSVVEGSRLLSPVLDVPTSVLKFNLNYEAPNRPAWRAFLVVEDPPSGSHSLSPFCWTRTAVKPVRSADDGGLTDAGARSGVTRQA